MVAAPKIIDRGLKDIVEQIRDSARGRVSVGVHASAGQEGGANLADIATWNEFGTSDGHVPARSFMRSTIDEEHESIKAVKLRAFASVIAGDRSVKQALGLIGTHVQGKIQEKIASSVPPPNALSTIEKKGSSTTLIDSGRLRQAITYEVHLDGKGGT